MTTKPKITITPKEGNIQFDIRQGNQTRWFSVEEETAKEMYQKLGDVLNEQDDVMLSESDWIEKEIAAFETEKNRLMNETSIFCQEKALRHSYPVHKDIGSSMYGTYGTERQHIPKIVKEGWNEISNISHTRRI